MQIGTAVPTKEELAEVQHHFIQHISIFDDYSVGNYEKDALQKIDELFEKHDIVCLTGGSGLYQKAVLEGLDDFPKVDETNQRKTSIKFMKTKVLNLYKIN